MSTSMYLETPAFSWIGLDGYETDTEISDFINALVIEGHDWVRLHSKVLKGCFTQWTVLERDENGTPRHIACVQFSGEVEIMSAEED